MSCLTLAYKAKISVIKQLENAKVLRQLEVLNKAGDMTAGFFNIILI